MSPGCDKQAFYIDGLRGLVVRDGGRDFCDLAVGNGQVMWSVDFVLGIDNVAVFEKDIVLGHGQVLV